MQKQDPLHVKIGSIVIDCNEFDKMLAFWQDTLHYVSKHPPKDEWVILRDPQGKSPNVSLNKIPKNIKGRIRLHLDLYTTDQEGEIERLLKMGATLYPRDYKSDEDFKILVDPEGNHFCVIQIPKNEKT
ncbi:MAG TPA: VOC family protein [Candidatus Bathyarchaeia archaeon]|nr:VOC family protein [Candidatus Bathyarchaeia archaeon]